MSSVGLLVLLPNFTNHGCSDSRDYITVHVLLASVQQCTRSWYKALSTQPKMAELHDTKHQSYIKSFFPVLTNAMGYSFALAGFTGGFLWYHLWLQMQHYAGSHPMPGVLVRVTEMLWITRGSVSVLCCQWLCHSLLRSHNKRFHGRHNCGQCRAPQLSQHSSKRGIACGVLAGSSEKLLRLL